MFLTVLKAHLYSDISDVFDVYIHVFVILSVKSKHSRKKTQTETYIFLITAIQNL